MLTSLRHFVAVWTVILPSFLAATNRNVDTLFVLYDAGETNAMLAVMGELEGTGTTYAAIGMATASSILKNQPEVMQKHFIAISECGVKEEVDQKSWPSDKPLSPPDLLLLSNCVASRTVVTGTASKIQLDVALKARAASKKVLAFYDTLSPIPAGSIAAAFDGAEIPLMVPTKDIAMGAKGKNVQVVGHPGCDSFAASGSLLNSSAIKQRLSFLNKGLPILVFVGGYGETYASVFKEFAQAASQLDQWNIVVSLHPKVDGTLEREILTQNNVTNVHMLAKPNTSANAITTQEAVFISDVVVSQGSTVGVQALILGKKVVYLDVPGSTFRDIGLLKGWAVQTFSSKEFLAAVIRKENLAPKNFFEAAGMPPNSARTMATLVN